MKMTIHYADCVGNQSNCLYPHSLEIYQSTKAEEIAKALSRDYTGSLFHDGYRTIANFIGSDCLMMDCDNTESDLFFDWTTPALVRDAFPNVPFIVHYSRNHMKQKNGKQARPKFHCLFPIDWVCNPAAYAELKRKVQAYYPHFDANAVDAARFFFGTEDAKIVVYDGGITLTEFMSGIDIPQKTEESQFSDTIPLGSRNTRLYSYATSLLKRFGNTKESREKFISESKKCSPPLGHDELNSIWKSALRFYEQIKARPDYIPPEHYNAKPEYMPNDFTHLGQAEKLADYASESLRYTSSTGFLCFNGTYWEESETKARGIVHQLTDLQLSETKAFDDGDGSYRKFVRSARSSTYITATLKEAASKLEIDPTELDKNPFLLCTPLGSYNLASGLLGFRPNRAEDYITKCTAVSPGGMGADLWSEFLDCVFCGDTELIQYVQQLCGLAAIGKVMEEALIISIGNGGNGKSTFWNTILKVMGKYGDTISSDILTFNCKRNAAPEIADIRGKRLLISSETQEGARLNESVIKQLCSTDNIRGEKKYRDPVSFTPTHTLMLFTNHLPKISSTDDGIWRRLKIIPFNAKFTDGNDIKGFSDVLFDSAGPAVLSWIIEGARTVIECEYSIEEPECVKNAIAEYRNNSNWFHLFISECCDIGEELSESSDLLYKSYRSWCGATGEYIRASKDFYREIDREEYKRITQKRQRLIKGIKLKTDFPGSQSATHTTPIL